VTHFDVHRGGLPPATPCPSDLELARFVEGTLPPDARTLTVSHLTECDDCREVVATVVAAQNADDITAPVAPATPTSQNATLPGTPPSSLHAAGTWAFGIAAAALLVIAVRAVPTRSEPPAAVAGASVWSEMAQLVGSARAIEPRLSGLPAHVPLQPPTRAASAEVGFAAQALAARLAERAALPTSDAAVRHAAAVAALLAGRADEAVTRLDAALAETPASAPERADLLADLAAAHAALADVTSRDHWTAALTAADQAVAMDAAHGAARFNRALALEHLQRRDAALAAWRDLAGDAAVPAGWREEAARHARALVP
jgi:hypothetical protein